ncbi:MAG: hypothetical protein KJ072_12455 [Verrucomicrobia bacterium]|nr:hypothetical protein [Verrucomicrobiota bacterium]
MPHGKTASSGVNRRQRIDTPAQSARTRLENPASIPCAATGAAQETPPANREADDITHGGPLVTLGEIAAMQKDLALPDLKKAVTLLVVPFDNLGGR